MVSINHGRKCQGEHLISRYTGKERGRERVEVIYDKIKAEISIKIAPTLVTTSQSPASSALHHLMKFPKPLYITTPAEDQSYHMIL